MNAGDKSGRRKAVASAVLLLATGMIAGATIDRMLSGRAALTAAPSPLTVEAMAQDLDLDAPDLERVPTLLDSVESDLAEAASAGPDSLRAFSRRARERLENALPRDRQDRFQDWMQEHHNRMMEGMRAAGMGK